MKDIAKDQEKLKTKQAVRETLGQYPYGRANNSPYRTQIQMKLILLESKYIGDYVIKILESNHE